MVLSLPCFCKNNQPKSNEIAIVLSQASLCQKTLDLDVLLGGCGEGQNSKNEVLSKDTKELTGGSFITYKKNPSFYSAEKLLGKGRFNFDRITVKYYQDQTAQNEAFKY